MKLLELLLVVAIIGLISSLYLSKVNVNDKLNGMQWKNAWYSYKVTVFMNPDFTEEQAVNLLSN